MANQTVINISGTRSALLDVIRLSRCENVGPVTFRQLLEVYGSAGKALEALPHLAEKGGRRSPKIVPLSHAEKELEEGQRLGAQCLVWGTPEYPAMLSAIESAPPFIWVLGSSHILHKEACAIVGARNASASGLRIAGGIGQALGQQGYMTVSGLARGIDTAVHQASLKTGTVAVLAGGIDHIYPPENKDLYHQIASGMGAIISEMPFGTEPQARLFPRRNRIISGLSQGVVVVEAALKSGSLVTARYALEQGREVMAIPGSPLDPRCEGTNGLIKDGAALIQSSQDVLHILQGLGGRDLFREDAKSLGGVFSSPPVSVSDITDEMRQKVMSLLSPTPLEMDILVRLSGLPVSVVVVILLELELAGELDRQPGARVALVGGGSF